MRSWIEHGDVTVEDPDADYVIDLVTSGTPFWLDIEDPPDLMIDRLAEALNLHPLAVEDSKDFAQRGKLVVYGDLAMIVGFGLDPDHGTPIEVHAYVTERFIVTFRRTPSVAIDELHRSHRMRDLLGGNPIIPLHRLIDALHGPFAAFIDGLERRLAAIEAAMLDEPLDDQLVQITSIRRIADDLRLTLTPGRDLAGRSTVIAALPGADADSMIYAADIADELRLIVSDLTSISDRCLASIGLHASLTSNRQGDASRQLAVVATVFLPITFVVGFFGMNFDVLVNDFEQGWPVFILFGLVLNVSCAVAIVWWLRRRGWA